MRLSMKKKEKAGEQETFHSRKQFWLAIGGCRFVMQLRCPTVREEVEAMNRRAERSGN